jgi:hypothetical protein
MKKSSIFLLVLFIIQCFSCGVKLENLDSSIGKFIAFSEMDKEYTAAKPYGIIIEKENEDYFFSIWYETIDGVTTTGREKITVSGSNYKPGDSDLINSFKVSDKGITCRATEAMYESMNIGPGLKQWVCREYDPSALEIFDVTLEETGRRLDKFTQLNSDISRERGIYNYARIENTGVVEKVTQTDEDTQVELASQGNVTIILSKMPGSVGFKEGDNVHYRGRITQIQLPLFEEQSIKIFLEDVCYK